MSYLIGVSLSAWGVWLLASLTMWFMMGALKHAIHINSGFQRSSRLQVRDVGSVWLSLSKNSEHGRLGWASLLGSALESWHTLDPGGGNVIQDSTGDDQKLHVWSSLTFHPICLFPLQICQRYSSSCLVSDLKGATRAVKSLSQYFFGIVIKKQLPGHVSKHS